MSFLSRLPLRQKLTWLAMTCSIVALLTTAVALGTYEWVFYRKTMYSHLTTLTVITARNSAAAVAFANSEDARRILSALDAEPAVVGAVLYDGTGAPFAEFWRAAKPAANLVPARAPVPGSVVVGSDLEITVPVVETKRFGTLVVLADVSAIRVRIAAYGIVLLCTTVVSGLLAYLLTGWLKQRIVSPVQALAAAAARVERNGDYSVRVPRESDDELGALTDAFNAMLARIEQKERQIARGAESLRLAVEAAQIGTWDWDLPNDLVVWNDRNYDLLGLERGAPISSGAFLTQVHPDDRLRVRAAMDAAFNASADFAVEFRVPQRDRVTYVVARGRFFRAPTGVVERAVGVTLDVTERRTAELRVIESELRFRAVAERAPAMIWSCDQDLNRDYFNKTWLTFTGHTLEEDLGTGWQDGMPAADLFRWQQVAGAAAAQRDPYSVEYRIRRADGALRWVVETGSPRMAADGSFAGYLGSCIDITARKENEEELEAYVRLRTRELQAANQDLESFSYSVSHDLRGPVRAIQGFTDIALEDLDEKNVGAARERIERVAKAADRMNKLIDAFISMARISRAELTVEAVDLSRLAEETISFLRTASPARVVDVRITPGLQAHGDERLLRIVLENLLGNAWKFTSKRERGRIEFGAEQRDGERVYYVRDNGAGFDASLSHKLFQAFERLHAGSQFEGLGVGLSTVHRVISKHNGRIWADAMPDQGAVFYFTVPDREPAPSVTERDPV